MTTATAMTYSKVFSLIALIVSLSACNGQPNVQCNAKPTTCGVTDLYGTQCLSLDDYFNAGYNVKNACNTCNFAVNGAQYSKCFGNQSGPSSSQP